jgi:hypothetical protein
MDILARRCSRGQPVQGWACQLSTHSAWCHAAPVSPVPLAVTNLAVSTWHGRRVVHQRQRLALARVLLPSVASTCGTRTAV